MVAFKKYQMVSIKKVSKVYEGPPTILVHLTQLKLKLTVKDLFE